MDDQRDRQADQPFAPAPWPKAIVSPDDHDGGDRLRLSWDLGIADGKQKKQAIETWCAKLPGQAHLKWLSLWSHVTQPLFDAACRATSLERFQVKWSNITTLDEIRRLQKLRHLHIGSSTRVESLQPLAALEELQRLEIENFKRVSDFSPLQSLTNLRSLAVTGSMWARQTVASLEPFARMTWLEHLAIDTSSVESLRPLARLTGLKSLGVGGRMPMAEYAWLSAKLPGTTCRWFKPYVDLASSGYGRCRKCGGDSMVMLTGKGARTLCRLCDKAQVERHAAAFHAVREAAMAE